MSIQADAEREVIRLQQSEAALRAERGRYREALRALIEYCEQLARIGYVHKSSGEPITWSPDGVLANAKAALTPQPACKKGEK